MPKIYVNDRVLTKLDKLCDRLGYGDRSRQFILEMSLNLLAAREGAVPIKDVPKIVLAPTPRQQQGDAPISPLARSLAEGKPINPRSLPAFKKEEGAMLGSLLGAMADDWN